MYVGHLGPNIQKRKYPRANKLSDAGKWELLGEKLKVGRGRKQDELNKRSR